jgi:hypothetical protein
MLKTDVFEPMLLLSCNGETEINNSRVHIVCTLYVHCMYIVCTLYVHCMYIVCTLYVHCMYVCMYVCMHVHIWSKRSKLIIHN